MKDLSSVQDIRCSLCICFSVRNFAIISFMGVYIKNDSRGTRDRLVTCDVS